MRKYKIDITLGLQVPAYSKNEAMQTVFEQIQCGYYDDMFHKGDGITVSCVGEVGVTEEKQ